MIIGLTFPSSMLVTVSVAAASMVVFRVAAALRNRLQAIAAIAGGSNPL